MPLDLQRFLWGSDLIGLFLTKNDWGKFQVRWIHIAGLVIPLPRSAAICAKHVSALLVAIHIVRFCSSPNMIASRQWSIVNPVELIVGFADKSKPRTHGCKGFLLLQQVEDEVVFIG